jgi:pyruvate/2-oxoacid:ferredoxin oxidoreductase beta subunit
MMSSATSINDTDAESLTRSSRASSSGDSLRPWHFFVLASLMAATAAVVLARESTPEHLVLISLTIGAAGFAGAALYRTLAPLVRADARPAADGLSESMRAVLEREKMLVLRSIKELEFDRAMGKLSEKDFEEMAARLRARAMTLMHQLDAGGGYRELIERELKARAGSPAREKRVRPTPPSTPVMPRNCACGAVNDLDAAFCKRCGTKLIAGSGA